jgi:tetratricopeptide (TPR) repeat protein
VRLRSRQGWLVRISLMVFVPVAVVLLVEGGLRLFGYGYPAAFLLPGKVNGKRVFVENERFSWRFFGSALARTPCPMVMPASKEGGMRRVFVFGGSAAYGDPKADYGLPRMLEVLLRERFPRVSFQVINAAMTGINSHVVREIARDCAKREGDVWVVYMGNNEVIGPYGSGTIFGTQAPGLGLIRTALALKRSRIGQLLASLSEPSGRRGPGRERGWGMGLFLGHQVRHDDPRMDVVYAHFARNLGDILRIGQNHGARVVVSTVVSNLRDCAPFASEHRLDLAESQAREWEQLYQAGCQAETAGDSTQAAKSFEEAARIDGHFADLQFRWGRCCLRLGREEEARRHFVLARDYDTLRFRADSRLNELIRKAAANREKQGVLLVDSETVFGRESADGLPGEDLLYDHVHFNFDGNYLLARAVAEQVARVLPESTGQRADDRPEWASKQECARRLGWSEWERCKTLQSLALRMGDVPFTSQLDHPQRYRRLQGQIERLLPALDRDGRAEAIRACRQAVALAPEDWVLQRNLGELLLKAGDLAGAETCCRQVTRLLPHYVMGYLELGLVLVQAKRPAEAISQFEAGLSIKPDSVPLLNGQAMALLRLGKPEAAIHRFLKALELRPEACETYLNLGTLLEASGRKEEAKDRFRQALNCGSDNPDGLLRLGKAALAQGWLEEAITNLTRAVQLNSAEATAHCCLAAALDAKGKTADALEHFAEAVRLEPENAVARVGLGAELRRQGKEQEAITQFAEAARLNPALPEAHVNLGLAWLHQHKNTDARREFEEALRIDPNNPVARQRLRSLTGTAPPDAGDGK